MSQVFAVRQVMISESLEVSADLLAGVVAQIYLGWALLQPVEASGHEASGRQALGLATQSATRHSNFAVRS